MRSLPLPEQVKVQEVVTRDGFQSEDRFIETKDKIELVNRIADAGISVIEVTSFVHPRVVPQLADAREVMNHITRRSGVVYSALVPNMKGAERALECNVDEWGLMVSLSETHSKANVNKSYREMVAEAERIVLLAKAENKRVNGGLLTALGYPGEGRIPMERIHEMMQVYTDLDVSIINVADTAGVSDPAHTYHVMSELCKAYPNVEFVLHLHDTRGTGMANALAGMLAGVRAFDTALGGIGGCPFLPGADGNISTVDFVNMAEAMGVHTGVQIDRLMAIEETLSRLLEKPLSSKVTRVEQLRRKLEQCD